AAARAHAAAPAPVRARAQDTAVHAHRAAARAGRPADPPPHPAVALARRLPHAAPGGAAGDRGGDGLDLVFPQRAGNRRDVLAAGPGPGAAIGRAASVSESRPLRSFRPPRHFMAAAAPE